MQVHLPVNYMYARKWLIANLAIDQSPPEGIQITFSFITLWLIVLCYKSYLHINHL